MRVFGRHGANPGEKDVPQPFDIDISLDVDLARARATDALRETIDYDELHTAVRRIVTTTSYDLLERLGQDILDAIFADGRVHSACIRIGKPRLMAGTTPVVTLRQSR